MIPFRYHMPTALYFGADCMNNAAGLFEGLGKRAFVVTYDIPKHYSLADLKEIFKNKGIDYEVNMETEENPSVTSIENIYKKAAAFKPDFLVAIGGGSVIDTTKAVSVMMKYPEKETMDVLFGGGLPHERIESEGALPLICVPTTAGTGSEATPYSVITREDIHTKQPMSKKVFPDYSFLDPNYVKELPAGLTRYGAMDTLAHAMESYIIGNYTAHANYMATQYAEIGFKLFSQYKDALVENKYTLEQREKMLLNSTLQGISIMLTSSGIPHAMGYHLTHFLNVQHGLACGLLLGEYIRLFKDKSIVTPIVNMCGFKDTDEFADYIKMLFPMNLSATDEEITAWATQVCSLKHKVARHPGPISVEEVAQIYKNTIRR